MKIVAAAKRFLFFPLPLVILLLLALVFTSLWLGTSFHVILTGANVLSVESSNSVQPQIIDAATKWIAAVFSAPTAYENAIELVLLIQKLCSKKKKMEHDTEGHPLGAMLASKEELAELRRELRQSISYEVGEVTERVDDLEKDLKRRNVVFDARKSGLKAGGSKSPTRKDVNKHND
ncbi:hypothetical protein N7540_010561 [Penicillium herquei]|nr:hypothetical protein N7540_010561 [Penicillium herquei]